MKSCCIFSLIGYSVQSLKTGPPFGNPGMGPPQVM